MRLAELLFSFKGRIRRLVWWVASLATGAIAAILTTLVDEGAVHFGHVATDPGSQTQIPTGPNAILGMAIALIDLWIALSLTVKRLHDRDRTGWWLAVQLAAVLLAAAALVAAWMVTAEAQIPVLPVLAGMAVLAATGLSLWLFVEVGFLRGTDGPNRFGEDLLASLKNDAKL